MSKIKLTSFADLKICDILALSAYLHPQKMLAQLNNLPHCQNTVFKLKFMSAVFVSVHHVAAFSKPLITRLLSCDVVQSKSLNYFCFIYPLFSSSSLCIKKYIVPNV